MITDEDIENFQELVDIVGGPMLFVDDEFGLLAWNQEAELLFRSYVDPANGVDLDEVTRSGVVEEIETELAANPTQSTISFAVDLGDEAGGQQEISVHRAEEFYIIIIPLD